MSHPIPGGLGQGHIYTGWPGPVPWDFTQVRAGPPVGSWGEPKGLVGGVSVLAGLC